MQLPHTPTREPSTSRSRLRPVGLAAAALLALSPLGACSSDEDSTSASSTSAGSTSVTAAGSGSVPTAPGTTPSAAGAKVSANDAAVADITAALEAAGVDNAARWAHEVEEYRPYPTDDPDLTHLREELEKYNPGPGVVDKIVGALQP